MKITELLSKDSILLGAAPQNKEEAIDTLVDLMEKGGKLNNREGYKQGVLERAESDLRRITLFCNLSLAAFYN